MPEDDRIRSAALALARRRHQETMRSRRWSFAVFGVLLFLSFAQAFTQTRWWLVASGFWIALVLMLWWFPARQRRRIAALEA